MDGCNVVADSPGVHSRKVVVVLYFSNILETAPVSSIGVISHNCRASVTRTRKGGSCNSPRILNATHGRHIFYVTASRTP